MKKRIPIVLVAVIAAVLCALPLTVRVVRAASYKEVGDFYFSSDENEGGGWTRDETNKVIRIINHGLFSVKNKNPDKATGWRIEIDDGIDVRLRLEGVNIDTKLSSGGSAITIEFGSTSDIQIEVVAGTVNRVTGYNGAGIQKNGDSVYRNNNGKVEKVDVGTLKFTGSGTLYAASTCDSNCDKTGAAIGAFSGSKTKNICIDGPTVYATGGEHSAGIGGSRNEDASNIVIKSGTVIAQGGFNGAGIGGGLNSGVDGVTIEGGTVTATGGLFAAGIGGGRDGSAKNIKISGGDVTAYGVGGSAGIGSGMVHLDSYQGKVDGITISGGVVRAFGSHSEGVEGVRLGCGAGIGSSCCIADGSGYCQDSVSNITISGGTVKAVGGTGGSRKADDIGLGYSYLGYHGSCTNIKITGGSVNAPSHGCQAVNGKGQSVALMTISNPDEKQYTVNGVKCTPCNSKAIDGDTNLYLYLAEGDVLKDNHDNALHFHMVDGKITTDTLKFVRCSGNDGYHYHEEKCTVSGCGVSYGKVAHNFENFKCKDCGCADERTFVCFKKGGAGSGTYSEISHVSFDAKIYELVDEPQMSGMSFKQWYYEKDGKKVVIACGAKLRDIADAIGGNGVDRWIDVYAEYKTRELKITGDGIKEGTDYSYSGDGVLTILSSKTMTISNVNPDEAATDRIVVAKNVNANIRLCNVYIDVSGGDNTAAFMIADDSSGNVTLTITNSDNGSYENRLISGQECAGIQKNGSNGSLTITEELTSSKVKVSLTARGGYGAAGIGSVAESNGANITILKGHITAYGGVGASGIGVGPVAVVSNIVIGDATGADKNGPTIIAVGGADADGNAGKGSESAPGIGVGGSGYCGDIYIYSGTVTAIGGEDANDIGRCDGTGGAMSGKIHILGGSVKAESVYKPIGASENTVASLIIENLTGADVYVDGEKYIPSNHTAADAKDTNLYLWLTTNVSHTVKVGENGIEYVYSYKNGRFDRERDLTIKSNTSEAAVEGTDYTYALGVLTILSDKSMTIGMRSGVTKTADRIVTAAGVNANITLSGVNIDTSETGDGANNIAGYAPITVADGSGENVTITLAAGSVNTLKSGYGSAAVQKCDGSGTLTITGKGTLNATGGDYGPGIGSAYCRNTSNIIILDGTIVAQGGSYGAGIGGGYRTYTKDSSSESGGGASNITIKGGNVTATGGIWAAGIGSGYAVNDSAQDKLIVSNITIEGGIVRAQGFYDCAGIGGGKWGSVSNITISGGDVTALGGSGGAGIGGGYYSNISGITVSGGKVTATGGSSGAGIGGGCSSLNIDGITISGGVVNANGGDGGAGIGGGGGGSLTENITISGGTITVTSKNGAGIGAGFYSNEKVEVVISGGSIRIAEPVNTDGRITPLIGAGGESSREPSCKLNVCIPKNGSGEEAKEVYLLVIANPSGKDVYIDGVKYTPSNHTAGDATDTNLYAYLTDGRHTVKLGDGKEKVYHYDKANSRFIETDCVDGDKDHACDYCGNISQCEDKNKNHKCDVCEAPMGVHEAAEGKHTCDYCGNTVSQCEDKNKNHECDVCGAPMGVHEAAEGKHTCDYCGEVVTQCEDKNKNHECDVCGKTMGEHKAAEGKHTCDYCGEVANAHTGGKATCSDEAVCDICGEKYGKRDSRNHRKLKHFEGKSATTEAEGNIEYWVCEGCNRYFSDANGENEITEAATVIAKLPAHGAPQTGSGASIWLPAAIVSGIFSAGAAVVLHGRKKSGIGNAMGE